MPTPFLVVPLLALAAAVALIAFRRLQLARRLTRIRSEWGHAIEVDRDMWSIARYHTMLVQAGAAPGALDDRTWADLDMDAVFQLLDRSESGIGRQCLYARLRTALAGERRLAFENLTSRLGEDQARRESAQLALGRLRDASAADLVSLTEPGAFDPKPWHIIFPILALAMAMSAVGALFSPAAVFLLILGSVASMFLRATIAHNLRIVAGAFRQVGPLLAAADELSALDRPDVSVILGTVTTDCRTLASLRKYAAWAGRDSSATPGDLTGIVFEYLNLLFCLDANALFFGSRELHRRGSELRRVIAAVGEVDAAISIASFRAGSSAWTRPVIQQPGSPVRMVNIRHPLLPSAVPNTVTLAPPHGLIITGSNMSGKSTFLRTVGVTTVLAQTTNTCLADEYEGPPLVVRSCIGRSDDMSQGKSYYMVEVEMVTDLVRAAQTPVPHLMLFDELFRGTNAVERIAAGEAVLAALLSQGTGDERPAHVVIAATHDQELVDLLAGIYAPFHFSDTLDAEGLSFDYRLMPGPATTRNAIALLGLHGAPPDLVARAMARAKILDEARSGNR